MSVARRLAYVAWCIGLGLLLLEGVLQLGAWYVRATAPEQPSRWLTDHRRILCLGDSNTYGLYLERSEAYPQQLETLWNQKVRSPKVEVLNLGFPGSNSSAVLSQLRGMLETFRPDVVLVLIGTNDFWTRPVERSHASGASVTSRGFLQRHSRVFKIYEMLQRVLRREELEVEFDPATGRNTRTGRARFGDREFELGWVRGQRVEDGKQIDERPEAPLVLLAENLHRIVVQVEASGAEVVLLTYASRTPLYEDANQIIRQVARASGARLIDLSAAVEVACPQLPCEEIFFEDDHPRAAGYRLIAETIIETLAPRGSVR